jgi:magnesium transporter
MSIHHAFGKAHTQKAHLPPGTLVYTGKHRTLKQRITVFDYNAADLKEMVLDSIDKCSHCKDTGTVTWINIDGLADIESIEKIGRMFNLHTLVLEDILNTVQRPKFELYNDYIFIVIKMLSLESAARKVTAEQVSMIVGKDFLITFQEYTGDVFDSVRSRLRNEKGQIRKMGTDYLAYALIDAIVDNYFVILETLGEESESIEDQLVSDITEAVMHRIHSMKRQMIFLRRSIWPLREVVSAMERSESPIIAKRTRIYIRDLYDHTIQIIDTVESLRDIAGGMLDTYLSAISNRMNAVMKILTIIATIFIPLTFIAGIYGMNFEHMPELHYSWAYPATLMVMVIIAVGMLVFFRRRKWL